MKYYIGKSSEIGGNVYFGKERIGHGWGKPIQELWSPFDSIEEAKRHKDYDVDFCDLLEYTDDFKFLRIL